MGQAILAANTLNKDTTTVLQFAAKGLLASGLIDRVVREAE
jgi:hypothetical protein